MGPDHRGPHRPGLRRIRRVLRDHVHAPSPAGAVVTAPLSPRVRADTGGSAREVERFEFRYAGFVGIAAKGVSAGPGRSHVEVSPEALTVRYGPWELTTPRSNIAEVRESGPFRPWKVAGPPHLSFSDGGITFATNSERGVCIRFFDRVSAIEPTGRLRHPGMTV